MNKVSLMGRITKDLELKTAGSTQIVKFSLAVPRIKKDEADFINCIAFGKTAENICKFFNKGSLLLIDGRIQTGSYKKEDGAKVYTTDVIIDKFYFTGSGNNTQATKEPQGQPVLTDTMVEDYFGSQGVQVVDNDDMPF